MGKMFLIGGGEITKKETVKIDKNIIKKGGGKKSRILFLPTAANNSENYIKIFFEYFNSLGCKDIKCARLSTESRKDIIRKMDWATVIYLGGGKTILLINMFRRKRLLSPLKKCVKNGVVLAGMSAGAAAMGEVSIVSEIDEALKIKQGFGILPDIVCLTHYHPCYKDKLKQIKSKFPHKTVIGLPEKSAIYLSEKGIKHYGKFFKI